MPPPSMPEEIRYLATDSKDLDAEGTLWTVGFRSRVTLSQCCRHPRATAVLHGLSRGAVPERIWEARLSIDADLEDETNEWLPLVGIGIRSLEPEFPTAFDWANAAVYAGRAAYGGKPAFQNWADDWLLGKDLSMESARAISRDLDQGAFRVGTALDAFHAADWSIQAAIHAIRWSGLGGRLATIEQEETFRAARETVQATAACANLSLSRAADRAVRSSDAHDVAHRPSGELTMPIAPYQLFPARRHRRTL